MVMTLMALDSNGVWQVKQLIAEVWRIVKNIKKFFDEATNIGSVNTKEYAEYDDSAISIQ